MNYEHASSEETEDELVHAEDDEDDDAKTVQDVYDSMNEKQKQVLHYMVGQALEAAEGGEAKQDNLEDSNQYRSGR